MLPQAVCIPLNLILSDPHVVGAYLWRLARLLAYIKVAYNPPHVVPANETVLRLSETHLATLVAGCAG